MKKDWIYVSTAAKLMGVSEPTARKIIRGGDFTIYKPDAHMRVSRNEVKAYVAGKIGTSEVI